MFILWKFSSIFIYLNSKAVNERMSFVAWTRSEAFKLNTLTSWANCRESRSQTSVSTEAFSSWQGAQRRHSKMCTYRSIHRKYLKLSVPLHEWSFAVERRKLQSGCLWNHMCSEPINNKELTSFSLRDFVCFSFLCLQLFTIMKCAFELYVYSSIHKISLERCKVKIICFFFVFSGSLVYHEFV